jgi:hypothetical protein
MWVTLLAKPPPPTGPAIPFAPSFSPNVHYMNPWKISLVKEPLAKHPPRQRQTAAFYFAQLFPQRKEIPRDTYPSENNHPYAPCKEHCPGNKAAKGEENIFSSHFGFRNTWAGPPRGAIKTGL